MQFSNPKIIFNYFEYRKHCQIAQVFFYYMDSSVQA